MKDLLIEKFNELYVSDNSHKHLAINRFGQYVTVAYSCTNYNIKNLIMQNKLLGLFSPKNGNGKEVTKFFTLDFDFADIKDAQKSVTKVLGIMEEKFGITEEQRMVNYSGNKGYHVTIYFNGYVSLKLLRVYYKLLLHMSGYSQKEIEFRPTSNQGVKLPLSKHLVTGKVAKFVNDSFEEITDYAILNVTLLEVDEFSEVVMEEVYPQYKDDVSYKESSKKINYNGDLQELFSKIEVDSEIELSNRLKAESILSSGVIPTKGSRHNTTMLLATYFNTQQELKSVAKEEIKKVVIRTYIEQRGKVSAKTKIEYAKKEVDRVVDYVYENNLTLAKRLDNIAVYKEELNKIMELPNNTLRKIALVLLIHSKGYNPSNSNNGKFFCSYRQLQNYGIHLSFESIKNYYNVLESLDILTITNKSDLSIEDELSGRKATTTFKLHIRNENGTDGVLINSNEYKFEDLDVEQFIGQLYEVEEVKDKYSKSTFYRSIKEKLLSAKETIGLVKILTAVEEIIEVMVRPIQFKILNPIFKAKNYDIFTSTLSCKKLKPNINYNINHIPIHYSPK